MDIPDSWRELPIGEYAFPGPLRDRLVAAILDGAKTTTTSLLAEYEAEAEPLPGVGDREMVVDSDGRGIAVTEISDIHVCRLAEVGLGHALGEGEGYVTVAQWRAGHEKFWHSAAYREAIGNPALTVDDDTRVVCVAFRVTARRAGL